MKLKKKLIASCAWRKKSLYYTIIVNNKKGELTMKPVFTIKNLKRSILANAVEVFSDDLDDWEKEFLKYAWRW